MTATIAGITGASGSTAAGNSTQRHVVFAPNSATWWAFWVDPASSTTLRSAYSSDLSTWTTSSTVTLANALANSADGRYMNAYVADVGGTDVVHVVIIGTSLTAVDCRGVLTASSVTWASNSITNPNTTSTPSAPDGVSAILASDGTFIMSSATVDTATNSGDDAHTVNATKDTTGSSWTPGPWTTVDDHLTSAIFMRNRSLHALASGNVLALWTADVNPPNNLVYSVISSASGAVTPANVYGSSVAFSDGTANEWGAARVTATDIHVVRRTGANTYEHIRWNGSSWSAGDSIPTQTSLSKNGIALTSDGSKVYMAVIDSAAGNAVQTTTWTSGSGWGSWSALDNTSATRSNITACQPSAASAAAFVWVENPSGTSFNIRVAGVSTSSSTPISVSDSATGSSAVVVQASFTLPDTATASNTSITIGLPLADSGAGTPALSIANVAVALSDNATGTGTPTIGVTLPQETGAGGGAVSLATVSIPLSEAAVAAETIAVEVDFAPADAGTGAGAVGLGTVNVTISDAANGNATLQFASVTLSPADAATGSSFVSVAGSGEVSINETGSGSGMAAITQPVIVAVQDSAGAAAVFALVPVVITVGEAASGADSITVDTGATTPVAIGESGEGAGTVVLVVVPVFFGASIGGATGSPGPTISATQQDTNGPIIGGTSRS